ncbi:MAG: HxsD-like protein [Candidatus Aenigmarchaeota archaeon]|nr:HxsD-like protein [Candidatus Aenigmarchaeota archaeon]
MNQAVIVKSNLIEVTLNSEFYPDDILEKAIEDYSKLFDIKIDKTKEKLKIILKPKQEIQDLQIIGYEFVNYLLYLIKNRCL